MHSAKTALWSQDDERSFGYRGNRRDPVLILIPDMLLTYGDLQ